jgi:hypothetical protein
MKHSWTTSNSEISKALNDRWEWLDHQGGGSEATRRATWRDLGDAGLAEDRVRQGYTGRYTIELFQNAHDACADAGVVGSVWFEATPSALLVGNQGVAFTASRITSLTRLGSSEKAKRDDRSHVIGYKGIGFTSVFEVSDQPQIISQDVTFRFDREEASRAVTMVLGGADEIVPARYFPLPLIDFAWRQDREAVERLLGEGAVTVIRLPLREGYSRDKLLDELHNVLTPELLLFARNLNQYEVRSERGLVKWRRELGSRKGRGALHHLLSQDGQSRSWVLHSNVINVPSKEISDLRDELWKTVRKLNVAVAFPWTSRGLDDEPQARNVFAYFPTSDFLGRGILIHGDFYLDDSRRRISHAGPQGQISARISAAAASLAVELAESLVSEGNRLLCCLAPIERPDGYGEQLGNILDQAFAQANIGRPADNGKPTQVSKLRRLAPSLKLAQERSLLSMLGSRSSILRPGEDRGRAEALLTALGCPSLQPSEISTLIEPKNSGLQYEDALALLETWLLSLGYVSEWTEQQFMKRPVVQDKRGNWRTPEQVMLRDAGMPPLPQFMARPEVALPELLLARKFISRLKIEHVTPVVAMQWLADFLTNNVHITGNEVIALTFAWEMWQREPKLVQGQLKVGALPVLAKTATGGRTQFARAQDVYFDVRWTGDRLLEAMYGAFGKCEFLAEMPPLHASEKEERQRFLRAIGVSDQPRLVRLTSSSSRLYREWQRDEHVSGAWNCPDGHFYTNREVEGLVLDRLDSLLERVEKHPPFARTFADGLLKLRNPYGSDALVTCSHSAHRHRSGNSTLGYQRWRLERARWVPVKNHPLGMQVARSIEAWSHFPRSGRDLMVPRAALSLEASKRLELVDAEAPSRSAIECALRQLREGYPDLREAPAEVRDTAEWLARRLDHLMTSKDAQLITPPLPCVNESGYVWSERPAIADIPDMPPFPDVLVMPPGPWHGLRRVYNLALASALVTRDVKVGARLRTPLILSELKRAELLAILIRKGGARAPLARRLANLKELATASIRVTWRSPAGAEIVTQESVQLVPHRDKSGRAEAGTLYHVGALSPQILALGRVLASYLGIQDAEHTVALFLSSGKQLVDQEGVVEEEVVEALELLRKRGLIESEESWPIESSNAAATGSAQPPSENLPPEASENNTPQPLAPESGKGEVNATKTPSSNDRPRVVVESVSFGTARSVAPSDIKRRRSGQTNIQSGQGVVNASAATSLPDVDPSPNPAIEELAMAIAQKYARLALGASEVIDVHLQNKGWDLEFHYPDGRSEPVEVKGSSGATSFMITRNELRAAREQPGYVLLHLFNLAAPDKAAMRIFRRLGELLTEEHLTSLSWVVERPGDLEPEEVPIEQRR